MYPNPNNGLMTLNYQLNEGESGTLEVVDLVGKRHHMQTLNGEHMTTTLSLSDVASGLYIISVRVNSEIRLSERISVMKY